jgi:nucleoside 2-deoxyribosyltransferase
MAFNADDGSVMERTFLAVAGKPVTAFNLDAALFTRTA